jgi:hypothetical protein
LWLVSKGQVTDQRGRGQMVLADEPKVRSKAEPVPGKAPGTAAGTTLCMRPSSAEPRLRGPTCPVLMKPYRSEIRIPRQPQAQLGEVDVHPLRSREPLSRISPASSTLCEVREAAEYPAGPDPPRSLTLQGGSALDRRVSSTPRPGTSTTGRQRVRPSQPRNVVAANGHPAERLDRGSQ